MSTTKSHVEQLAALVEKAKVALEKAKEYANKHSLSFEWDLSYGSRMQEYLGKGFLEEVYDYEKDTWGKKPTEKGKWVSSSDGC